jgi:hypothetical protein
MMGDGDGNWNYFKYRVLQNPKLNLRYLSYFLQNKNIK